jgi:hypothetical protein
MATTLKTLKNQFLERDELSFFDKFFEENLESSTESCDRFIEKLQKPDYDDMFKIIDYNVSHPPTQLAHGTIEAIEFVLSCYFSSALKANNDITSQLPVTKPFIKKMQYVDIILQAKDEHPLKLEPDHEIREWGQKLYSALYRVQNFSNSLQPPLLSSMFWEFCYLLGLK